MLFRVVQVPEMAEKFDINQEDKAQELLKGLPAELEGRVEPVATSYGKKWVIKVWPKGTHHLHENRGWIKKVKRRARKPVETQEDW